MHYVREIDGLRGIAASGIVLFHMIPSYTFWMWSFVDLFFVLSGFLVTGILLQERLKGTLSLKNFWIRRILRIWPVYFLTLLGVVLMLFLLFGLEALQQQYGPHLRLSGLFLQFTPYYVLGNGDPWQPFDFIPGFFHSWSIAIEEQFYLLWPLLLLVLLRTDKTRYAIAVCFLLLGFSVSSRLLLGWEPWMLLSRLDGLALGALLALLIYQKKISTSTWTMRLVFCACLALGLGSALPYLYLGYTEGAGAQEFFDRPLIVTSFAIMYFGVLGLVLDKSGSIWTVFLCHPVLVYLGSISYAMYMFHFPVLIFLKPRLVSTLGNEYHFLLYPGLGLIIILLCHLSKHFVERPVLALKKYFY